MEHRTPAAPEPARTMMSRRSMLGPLPRHGLGRTRSSL